MNRFFNSFAVVLGLVMAVHGQLAFAEGDDEHLSDERKDKNEFPAKMKAVLEKLDKVLGQPERDRQERISTISTTYRQRERSLGGTMNAEGKPETRERNGQLAVAEGVDEHLSNERKYKNEFPAKMVRFLKELDEVLGQPERDRQERISTISTTGTNRRAGSLSNAVNAEGERETDASSGPWSNNEQDSLPEIIKETEQELILAMQIEQMEKMLSESQGRLGDEISRLKQQNLNDGKSPATGTLEKRLEQVNDAISELTRRYPAYWVKPGALIFRLADKDETNPQQIANKSVNVTLEQIKRSPIKAQQMSLVWDGILAQIQQDGVACARGERTLQAQTVRLVEEILDGAHDIHLLKTLMSESRGYGALRDCLVAVTRNRLREKIAKLQEGACFTLQPETFNHQLAEKSTEVQSKVQKDFERYLALSAFGVDGLFAPLPSDPQTLEKLPSEERHAFREEVVEPLAKSMRLALASSFSQMAGKCVQPRNIMESFATVEKRGSPDVTPIDKLLTFKNEGANKAVEESESRTPPMPVLPSHSK